jgi:para-nitrobenzyl esterase
MAPTNPPPTQDGYPVIFWIHGGAFEQGLGNCALYNGTQFAKENVVSVVINYRLGALGFMASASMQGLTLSQYTITIY